MVGGLGRVAQGLLLLTLVAGCASAQGVPVCNQAGVVRQERVDSPMLGHSIPFEVYLPPCYDPDAGDSYPVLYLIPGGGGRANTVLAEMGIAEVADHLIHSGQLPPFLMVSMANLSDDRHGAALVEDLVSYVDTHYGTAADRQQRAVGGFSLGGLYAYRMAFQHPELFGSLGLFGGVVHDRAETLDAWLAGIPAGQIPRVLIACGAEDPVLPRVRGLADALERRGAPYRLNIVPGGHDVETWMGHLGRYLHWVAEEW